MTLEGFETYRMGLELLGRMRRTSLGNLRRALAR